MFTKQEAAQLRKEFWTAFGKYMQPIPSANGEPCHWVNYKTGVKYIRFHLEADTICATAAIELSHPDFEERKAVKRSLSLLLKEKDSFPGDWGWKEDEERGMDCYLTQLEQVHILRKEDWPQIISFLKTAMLALDAFWVENKAIFEP